METTEKEYYVHPRGMAGADEIGPGTRIWAHAHVMKGARVGANCNICECSFVEAGGVLGDRVTIKNGVQIWDGVTCEDCVFVGPNATFTNDLAPRVEFPVDPSEFARTLVCHGASLGANCTIIAGNQIGRYAMVGAGAVVTRDVPAHALVVGNPARPVGWVCVCGMKLPHGLRCNGCERNYRETEDGLECVS